MRRTAWLVALTVGCYSDVQLSAPSDGNIPHADTRGDGDGSGDIGSDAGSGSACATFLPGACLGTDSGATSGLPSLIDTGGPTCSPGFAAVCVVAFDQSIVASGTIRVVGGRPLALLVAGALTLDQNAVVDASSYLTGSAGPGASDLACSTPAPPATDGAGGGGATTAGGGGGQGPDAGAPSGGGGPTGTPTQLVAGCPGAAGGSAVPTSSHATAGLGGGAIYLFARGQLTVAGKILASGAGGGGGGLAGTAGGGGGGGGAGGLVVLESTTSVVGGLGIVETCGGGGGGGGGTTTSGNPGQDGAPVGAAGGLSAAGSQGGGGAGGVTGSPGAGSSSLSLGVGGGGGGGAAGFVLTFGNVVSLATPVCGALTSN